jgi:preprotein translocase subunit SecG
MNDRQSRGRGWAIAGGIALVVAAIVVVVVLVAGGSSSSSGTSSGASHSISISRTTTIVNPTRTVTNSTSSTP